MGTARSDVYELLKTNLLLEDAVTGEAAGLAMGLVMLGTGSAQAIEDMVQVSEREPRTSIVTLTHLAVRPRHAAREDSARLSHWYRSG